MKKHISIGLLVACVLTSSTALAQTTESRTVVKTEQKTLTPAKKESTQPISSCIKLTKNMDRGSTNRTKNNEVSKLQNFLISYKYNTKNLEGTSGNYLNETRNSVVNFQKANKMSQIDGKIKNVDRAKIRKLTCGIDPIPPKVSPTPKPGTKPTVTPRPTATPRPTVTPTGQSANLGGSCRVVTDSKNVTNKSMLPRGTITWTAVPTGGSGSYRYTWLDDAALLGNSPTGRTSSLVVDSSYVNTSLDGRVTITDAVSGATITTQPCNISFNDFPVVNPNPTPNPQPTPVPNTTPTPIIINPSTSQRPTIIGDQNCIAKLTQALDFVQEKSPSDYARVISHIDILECVAQGTGTYGSEYPVRTVIGVQTLNADLMWVAGMLVHEAHHSYLFRNLKPWLGREGEWECLTAQANFYRVAGAPQSVIDYTLDQINTNYWEGAITW